MSSIAVSQTPRSRAVPALKLPPPNVDRLNVSDARKATASVTHIVSNVELAEAVEHRLRHGLPTLATVVRVSAANGQVTLQGVVVSDYERSLLLQTVRQVSAVKGIVNQIRVQPATTSAGGERRGIHRWVVRISAVVVVAILAGIGWHLTAESALQDAAPPPLVVTVTYKGQPAIGAFVRLYAPAAPASTPLRAGRVGPKGTVDWSSGAASLPEGDLVATAVWSRPTLSNQQVRIGPNVLPEAWSDPATSPLRLTPNESAATPLNLTPSSNAVHQ